MEWLDRWRERRRIKSERSRLRLEREAEKLDQATQQSRRSELAELAEALGQSLERTFQIQAKMMEGSAALIGVLQEASARKAAQVLGRRGGQRTQERRRSLPKPPSCPLCIDPNFGHPTPAMIDLHRMHQAANNGSLSEHG